ncbi:MAG TPA: VRR-NUC domain-containing protein [Gammaproteobacteria bacterium]|nr:VRR-NUC domain-containing protein [Gammaproteobacteria bacterium]
MLEQAIEDRFVRRAEDRGALAPKFEPPGSNGWPDRIVFLPDGRVLLVEFKAPGERPRRLQRTRHRQLRERDHVVHVCDSHEKADALIEQYLPA